MSHPFEKQVTERLIETGKFDHAALYSPSGEFWAETGKLSFEQDVVNAILKGFEDLSDLKKKGLLVCGKKYFLLRGDAKSIYLQHELDYVIAYRNNRILFLGHNPDGAGFKKAITIVEMYFRV